MDSGQPSHSRKTDERTHQRQPRACRRTFLIGATVGSLALAGCLGGDSPPDGSDDADEEVDVDEGPRIELNGITLASAFPIRLVDVETEEVLGDLHYHGEDFTHWHGVPVTIPANSSRTIDVLLTDDTGDRVAVGETDISVDLPVAADSPRGVVAIEIDGDRVTFTAESRATTELVLQLLNDGDIQYETPDIPVVVE